MRRSLSHLSGRTLALWIAAALAGVALTLAPAQLFAQAAATVSVGGNDELGDFLVAANGMTLYFFTKDGPETSNCSGRCEEAWPPLTIADGIEPSAGAGVSGTLGVAARSDGSLQVTYNGAPLYFWARDSATGDATGQAVGGVWYVISTATGFATALTVVDQPFETDTARLVVPAAALDQPFYVVVHEGDAGSFGAVIGSTGLFQPGAYAKIAVSLDRPLVAGEYVWPMLHTEDSGNGAYDDPATDKPVVHAAAGNGSFGGVVVFRSQITQPVAAPSTGNAGLLTGGGGTTAAATLFGVSVIVALLLGGRAQTARRREP